VVSPHGIIFIGLLFTYLFSCSSWGYNIDRKGRDKASRGIFVYEESLEFKSILKTFRGIRDEEKPLYSMSLASVEYSCVLRGPK